MAEADLDVLIRTIARKNSKSLLDAAKKRRGKYMAMAAKAANKATRDRYRSIAQNTVLFATAAAKRIQISAENAADSYLRSVKYAAEEMAANAPVEKAPAAKAPAAKAPATKAPAGKKAGKKAKTS
jgi:hypothetical protein